MFSTQTLLATVTFRPEGLIGWIIVGLIAGWAASHVISLPMFPDMDAEQQQTVIDAVKKSIEFSMQKS